MGGLEILPQCHRSISFCVETPFSAVAATFQILERFTCVLYEKTTPISKVNELRKDQESKADGQYSCNTGMMYACRYFKQSSEFALFCQAALLQHAHVSSKYLGHEPSTSATPEGYGWTLQEEVWKPIWTLLPEELLKCGCKALPLCSRKCKCKDAGSSCTALCHCSGSCDP